VKNALRRFITDSLSFGVQVDFLESSPNLLPQVSYGCGTPAVVTQPSHALILGCDGTIELALAPCDGKLCPPTTFLTTFSVSLGFGLYLAKWDSVTNTLNERDPLDYQDVSTDDWLWRENIVFSWVAPNPGQSFLFPSSRVIRPAIPKCRVGFNQALVLVINSEINACSDLDIAVGATIGLHAVSFLRYRAELS